MDFLHEYESISPGGWRMPPQSIRHRLPSLFEAWRPRGRLRATLLVRNAGIRP